MKIVITTNDTKLWYAILGCVDLLMKHWPAKTEFKATIVSEK